MAGPRWGALLLAGTAALGWGLGLIGTPAVAGAAPAGWKTVRYQGLTLAVPESWPVEQWRPNCGSPTPVVYLGPEGNPPASCPSVQHGAMVVLGAKLPRGGLWVLEIQNGVRISVKSSDETVQQPVGTIRNIWASAHGGDIFISVGQSAAFPGGAPRRANEILATMTSTTPSGGGGHLG